MAGFKNSDLNDRTALPDTWGVFQTATVHTVLDYLAGGNHRIDIINVQRELRKELPFSALMEEKNNSYKRGYFNGLAIILAALKNKNIMNNISKMI